MRIGDRMVVSLEVTMRTTAGEVVDGGTHSFRYLHGAAHLALPELERRLDGLENGDVLEAMLPPEDAFGRLTTVKLPRGFFDRATVGQSFLLRTASGAMKHCTMIVPLEILDDVMIVEQGHPYGGQTLHFTVRVVDVQAATAQEVANGHPHGEPRGSLSIFLR
jgi:FKBP-type peptidyl-prolyl cis-trans isomerase SlyD